MKSSKYLFLLLELLSVPRNLFYVNILKTDIYFLLKTNHMVWLPSDSTGYISMTYWNFSIAAIYFKDTIPLEKQKNFDFLKLFQQNKQLIKAELLEILQAEILW